MGRALACSVASGVCLAASFPPSAHWYLALFALVPLLWAARTGSWVHAAACGWIAGTVFTGLVTRWIAATLAAHTALGWTLSVAAHLAMSAILGLTLAVVALAAWAAHRCGRGAILLPAGALALVEAARGAHPFGFPWTLLGYTQVDGPLAPLAAMAGVAGVGAAVVAVNATLAGGWRSPARTVLPLAVVAAALAVWSAPAGTTAPAWTLDLALVDGHVAEQDKGDPRQAERTFARYLALTRDVLGANPRLVVWPESALPFAWDERAAERAAVRALFAETGAHAIIGAPAPVRAGLRGLRQHNRAWVIGPHDGDERWHDKHVLVPFGEYVPGRWLRRWVRPVAPSAGRLVPGRALDAFDVGGVRAGVLVCYEHLFPHVGAALVERGAQVLVNVANDGWFQSPLPARQQLAQLRLRALALGVPIVRVANRGPAAVIDARGSVRWTAAATGPRAWPVRVPLTAGESTPLFARPRHDSSRGR